MANGGSPIAPRHLQAILVGRNSFARSVFRSCCEYEETQAAERGGVAFASKLMGFQIARSP